MANEAPLVLQVRKKEDTINDVLSTANHCRFNRRVFLRLFCDEQIRSSRLSYLYWVGSRRRCRRAADTSGVKENSKLPVSFGCLRFS